MERNQLITDNSVLTNFPYNYLLLIAYYVQHTKITPL